VVLQITQFVVFVVAGCDCFKVEWDDNNNVSKLDALPVVPQELVKVVS
jgi:hypothetical protein